MHFKLGLVLSAVFIVLQILDGYTTWKALTTLTGREANPLFEFVFKKLGIIPGLLVTKIPIIGATLGLAFLTRRPDYVLLIPVLGYVAVVVNNVLVLKRG